jgi:hypothetical protein
MCGGFIALYSAQSKNSIFSHIAYHLGRLLTYLCLGALGGFLGQSIDNLGLIAGISHLATILVGLIFIIWGITIFSEKRAGQSFLWLSLPLKYLLSRATKYPPTLMALTLGIFTTLLPCGWLYAYVTLAVGTSSIINGMLVMLFFWLGTVPLLSALGFFSGKIFPKGLALAPRATAVLLILAGVFSIGSHYAFWPLAPSSHHHTTNHH